MKHFFIIGLILLFCFGVLPEFVINNSYGGIEKTAKAVETQYAKINMPKVSFMDNSSDEEESLTDTRENEGDLDEKTNDDEKKIKIKPWLKKSDKEKIDGESEASKSFPLEEKMLNDHKKERANKEVPGSSNLKLVGESDVDLTKGSDYAKLLKIVENATVVLNDGITNVKVGA